MNNGYHEQEWLIRLSTRNSMAALICDIVGESPQWDEYDSWECLPSVYDPEVEI